MPYVGEAIAVVAQAVDPNTQTQITDATAEAEFYAPPKNPAKNPADRDRDKGPFPLTWDATVQNKDGTTGAYVGYVETAAWAPGKWAFKVTLSGSFDSWEYGTVKLEA